MQIAPTKEQERLICMLTRAYTERKGREKEENMKNVCLLLCVVTLLACGCHAVEQSKTEPPHFSLCESSSEASRLCVPTDLGVPYASRYASYPPAMTPTDLIVYDGCLYVASGDWSGNMGPIDMLCYDTARREWKHSGTLPDEEVAFFFEIEDTLVTPGIDPRDGWEWGNLYILQNGTWQTRRTIPNGIHCFDLAYHGGTLFAAVTTGGDGLQAAVSHDMGETFSLVPLIKDGLPVTATDKYFDLFVIGDAVYAYATHGLYRYDGTRFVFETAWRDEVRTNYYNTPQKARMFRADATVDGTLYLATGNFYACAQADAVRQIQTPNGERVYDICLHGGDMYLLCDLKTDMGYTVTVYRFLQDTETFVQETAFASDIPAVSLAVEEGGYYFGMASNNMRNKNHGRILKIEKTF